MKFIPLLILLLSTHSVAGRHMAYMGGSGDPAGATTIFDHKIPIFANYARESASNVSVAFDGGHTSTEQSVRTNFAGSPVQNFTPAAYESIIAGYERQLLNGQIKDGDQIMVVIDSHGARRYGDTATHTVSAGDRPATDLIRLEGSQTVSLDRLQNLARLALEKNVRLAILDYSCHSGASLPLANSRTCVITASGPETFAFGGSSRDIFSNRLTSALRPGRNLEDAFLEARGGATDLGFPMISSGAGQSVQDRLYPLLRRYLNYQENKADKFSEEILDSVKNNTCEQENADVQNILALTREMEEINSEIDLGALRNAVQTYHEYRRTIQRELENMGVGRLKETRRFCGVPSIGCNDLPLELILVMNPDQNLNEYRRQLASATTEAERTRNRQWITYFETVKAAREELLRQNPNFRNYSMSLKDYPNINQRTSELARRVSEESRRAYSSLYQRSIAPDACKDFVL